MRRESRHTASTPFATLKGAEPGSGDESDGCEDNGADCEGRYDLQNVATHEAGHWSAKGCSVSGGAASGGTAPLGVFFLGVALVFARRRKRDGAASV